MVQVYATVSAYVLQIRNILQDLIVPYRYPDDQVVNSLNQALSEMGRIRSDIFLDLKYQQSLRKGDLDEGAPLVYGTADIAFLPDGVTYDPSKGALVPVPTKYIMPILWYMEGWLQLFDVEDTQDQRAMAFLQKFEKSLMTAT